MADTLPSPQYRLPQQALPQGLDVAASTPPNALSQIGPGIIQGASLGFQARQTAALEQERQTQLMAAQVAAQQARKASNIAALAAVGEQYDRLSKIHPDDAFDLYKSKLAPLMSAVVSDTGLPADFHTDANPSHETADTVKRMHDAVSGLADGTIDMPTFQKIMNGIQSQNNIGEYAQKRIDEATKAGNTIQDYNKNIQSMEKDARQQINTVRGDTNFQRLESQRNGAAGVYSLLRQNQDEKGNYNLTKQQLVDLNSKLYTGLNGVAPTETALKELMGSSAQSLYSELAARVGLARNALPKQIGDRLLEMSEQAGNFAEAQHDSMLQGRLSQMNTALPEHIKQAVIRDISPRGQTFQEMKAIADKQSKYQPNIPKFKSAAEAEKSNVPKGSIVLINGKKYRKD